MVITHETTIAEYEAWLYGNPSFTQFKRAVRSAFKMAYAVIRRVRNILSEKRRSCLAPMACRVVMPLDYNRNAIGTNREHASLEEWRAGVWKARVSVRRHIERHEMFDMLADTAWGSRVAMERHERISRVEKELAMEQLHAEALEILVKN